MNDIAVRVLAGERNAVGAVGMVLVGGYGKCDREVV